MSYCHLVASRSTFIRKKMKLWFITTDGSKYYCSRLVGADTKAAPNQCNIRLLSQWQNGPITSSLWFIVNVAADVAAVASALCGLIMETDSNKTAPQRSGQTGSRLRAWFHFWVKSWVFCSWEFCLIDGCIAPWGHTECGTCGFTDVRGLSRIICEQVE